MLMCFVCAVYCRIFLRDADMVQFSEGRGVLMCFVYAVFTGRRSKRTKLEIARGRLLEMLLRARAGAFGPHWRCACRQAIIIVTLVHER